MAENADDLLATAFAGQPPKQWVEAHGPVGRAGRPSVPGPENVEVDKVRAEAGDPRVREQRVAARSANVFLTRAQEVVWPPRRPIARTLLERPGHPGVRS
jgi:hypothetical protein